MHPLESLDIVENILSGLMGRDEPMVRKLPPEPGGRAPRYAQLLCPNLHPLGPTEFGGATAAPASPGVTQAAAAPSTLDPNLAKHPAQGIGLSREDQAALVAFLKTLTDPNYENRTTVPEQK